MTTCPRCKTQEKQRYALHGIALCASCIKELEEGRHNFQDAALAECERIEDLRAAYWE